MIRVVPETISYHGYVTIRDSSGTTRQSVRIEGNTVAALKEAARREAQHESNRLGVPLTGTIEPDVKVRSNGSIREGTYRDGYVRT